MLWSIQNSHGCVLAALQHLEPFLSTVRKKALFRILKGSLNTQKKNQQFFLSDKLNLRFTDGTNDRISQGKVGTAVLVPLSLQSMKYVQVTWYNFKFTRDSDGGIFFCYEFHLYINICIWYTDIFKRFIYFNIFVWLFCLHTHLCSIHMPNVFWRQKMVSYPLNWSYR